MILVYLIQNNYRLFEFRIVIYIDFCLDVEQGLINWAPNETRTYTWKFASLAC